MGTSRVFTVCLVMAAAATAQQPFPAGGGLIFWVPVLRQPVVTAPFPAAVHTPFAVAKAAPPAPATNSDSITVPAATATSSAATPDVITHGLHLGDNVDPHSSGFADDTPASVITHGPYPGSYTAVSSDEPSESTQFQSHDGQGSFLFGHSSPQQARLESRSADGTVRGSYSYVTPEGRTIKVSYTAGENGFQPVEDSADGTGVFPQPVTDTPEVVAARALHARLYDRARWLAESSPDPDEKPSIETSFPVTQQPPSVQVSDDSDPNHQPDSLYANMGSMGVDSSEEDLTYYGAAKGKPAPYSALLASKTAHHDYYGAGKTYGTPLAYSGAYVFPNSHHYFPGFNNGPIVSPFSVPSLYEQQNLHRVTPESNKQTQAENHVEVLQARMAQPSNAPQNLEYYGAAKLLAYSAVNHLLDSGSSRRGKSLSEPSAADPTTSPEVPKEADDQEAPVKEEVAPPKPAAVVAAAASPDAPPTVSDTPAEVPAVPSVAHEPRFSSYQQAAPVFVAVGVSPQAQLQDTPLLRTTLQQASHPAIVPPASVSQKAAYFGAVPVAAVHDAQVAPGQSVKDHQKLPVYIESN